MGDGRGGSRPFHTALVLGGAGVANWRYYLLRIIQWGHPPAYARRVPARIGLAIVEAMMREALGSDKVDELLAPPARAADQSMDEVRAAIILAGGEVLA